MFPVIVCPELYFCPLLRLGSHMVLLLSVIMLGVTLTVVPECTVLASLTSTLAVMGFFMGTIDTVANISMLQLYGRDVAPFLQVCLFLAMTLFPINSEINTNLRL